MSLFAFMSMKSVSANLLGTMSASKEDIWSGHRYMPPPRTQILILGSWYVKNFKIPFHSTIGYTFFVILSPKEYESYAYGLIAQWHLFFFLFLCCRFDLKVTRREKTEK